MKILVAACPTIAGELNNHLRFKGHSVHGVRTGLELCTTDSLNDFDLLIIDINIGIMDGVEIAKFLSIWHIGIPLVLIHTNGHTKLSNVIRYKMPVGILCTPFALNHVDQCLEKIPDGHNSYPTNALRR